MKPKPNRREAHRVGEPSDFRLSVVDDKLIARMEHGRKWIEMEWPASVAGLFLRQLGKGWVLSAPRTRSGRGWRT